MKHYSITILITSTVLTVNRYSTGLSFLQEKSKTINIRANFLIVKIFRLKLKLHKINFVLYLRCIFKIQTNLLVLHLLKKQFVL